MNSLWKKQMFTYNLAKDNSGPKRWYNGRKGSTKRERHRLREREAGRTWQGRGWSVLEETWAYVCETTVSNERGSLISH